VGGKVPASRLSVYAATKYGLRGFGACLRQELEPDGIGVSVVFPGSVHDVGLWAESGAISTVGTVSSATVAERVVTAIERNRAEIDVAPWPVRFGGFVAHVAPGTFVSLAKRLGADRETAALAEGLRHKR
jgi:short-subunit dehydrogenase